MSSYGEAGDLPGFPYLSAAMISDLPGAAGERLQGFAAADLAELVNPHGICRVDRLTDGGGDLPEAVGFERFSPESERAFGQLTDLVRKAQGGWEVRPALVNGRLGRRDLLSRAGW